MTNTLGSDPSTVMPLEDDADAVLAQEANGAPVSETVLRAAISLRGHLNASLSMMRDMVAAAKEGDLKAVKMLSVEAEALIAENQMLGMDVTKYPTLPSHGEKLTLEHVEAIFGIQRARIAAREAKKSRGTR